jgi:putative oxidoreductase
MEDKDMTERSSSAYAALLLRVAMGVMFIAHGLILKVLEYGVDGTRQYFVSEGYPALLAYVVIAAEIGGGAMLILGYKVRAVALAFVPLMVGATLEHVGNGWMFGYPGGGYEFPVFWTVALLVQALLGPGAFALEGGRAGRGNEQLQAVRA